MGLRGWSHDFPKKIQDGGRRLYWISYNAIIFELNEDIRTDFGTNVQHDHAQMLTWPKTEPEINSHNDITSSTGNIWKMAFSLRVVESVSDDYNF